MADMQFSRAAIIFDDDNWEEANRKLPHSDVEIHDNGWVSAQVVEEDSDEKTVAYYSPEKVHAVFPEDD